ncbi:MAG: glycosyltransferase family A protein, partial [Pyrinomonadaceae bacterium]
MESKITSQKSGEALQPAVAVVVPSYNHAPFIRSTLHSIFSQTLPPAELLVIDDGSSDRSPEIIEGILKDCPFPCELIVRANRGLCATLNEGLVKTGGKYFAYLSSDDVWLAEFLEARVSCLEPRPQAVLAFGHCFLIDDQNLIIDCTCDWANSEYRDARRMLLQQTFAPMSPTVLYRRAPLEAERWDEQAKLEDYDLYLRLSIAGEFAFDPQVRSAWRKHAHNTSRDFSWMIEARLEAQRRVAERLDLSQRELEHYQRVLRFAGAEDLCRLGQKAEALKLLKQSAGGAPSIPARLRLLARLFVPNSLMMWRRRRKAQNAAERYGPLVI